MYKLEVKKYSLLSIGMLYCFIAFTQIDSSGYGKYDSTRLMDVLTKPNTKIIYGIASYYSKHLEGTHTSSGEKFSHHLYTAASNHFKLGTWVKVINLQNNKSVIVKINDRMHSRMHKNGRVVDLSYSAAKELSFIQQGLTKVRVEIVASP